MICHLPRLLLPQRLSSITSLEITWSLKTNPVETDLDSADLDEAHLETFLQLLSSHFSQLGRLCVSLEESDMCDFHPMTEEKHVKVIEKHLDEFSQRMAGLRECVFSLPEFLFEYAYSDATSIPEKHGDYEMWISVDSYRQVWRTVNGGSTAVRLPYLDSYPRPPFHLDCDSTQVHGYWMLEGSNRPQQSGSPFIGSCIPDMDDVRVLI